MTEVRFCAACAAAVLVLLGLVSCTAHGSGDRVAAARDESGDRDREVPGDIVSPARFAPPALPPPSPERTADGRPGPAYWQQQADYEIDATLDDEARTVSGREVVRYTNNSPLPLDYIWMYLDQNLYRLDSDGARLTRPGARFGNQGFDGGVELYSVECGGQPLQTHTFGTLARIDLPEGQAIPAAGGVFEFTVRWSFKVPAYGSDRMGVFEGKDGPVFQIAQWYPQVCKYDDVHGWNTLPYLGQGEFYSDFGDYTVSLTVPAAHVVAASGVLENPDQVLTEIERARWSSAQAGADTVVIRSCDEATDPAARTGEGVRTWRFHSRRARAFAWASGRGLAWDGAAAQVGASIVFCQSFYPREAQQLWGPKGSGGGATQMLKTSIEHYSKRWFPYPYAAASNVNGLCGGMEYPMLIFCKEREEERGLWGVTTHEIGHTWFPMVVNSDERRHAWMDEGFNSFINHFATMERYGDVGQGNNLRRRLVPRTWGEANRELTQQPVEMPADMVAPGLLGRLEYSKTAMGLLVLREAVLGPERFDEAFREYIRRWAFKSPQPADFFRTMEDAAGMDLGWFWNGWFYGTGVLDQAVTTVMQAEGESRNARITFKNAGQMVMPLAYRVEYTDGTSEDRSLPVQAWSWTDSWQTTFDVKGRTIRRVTVDPDGKLPDADRSNNEWKR